MEILSEWDKKYVKEMADLLLEDKTDWKKRENLEEIWAAIYIIEKILGSDWYRRSVKEITEKGIQDSEMNPENFQTPISFYLGKKTPEFYGKIIQFAFFLTILIGKTNVEEKIREYQRKEKRSEVTRNIFDGLFFEFKVASYFVDKDFDVEFIKENKNISTPDLKVSSNNNSIVIECKRKRTDGFSIEKILDSIQRGNEQLEKSQMEGIIAIEFTYTEKTSLDFNDITLKINNEIRNKTRILGIWLVGELAYEREGKMHIASNCKIFLNYNVKDKIPHDILESLHNVKAPVQQSLIRN